MSRNNVSHAAIVLSVKDIQASIAFYRDKLGFDLTFSWGDPTNYAVLKTGEVSVHLSEDDNPRTTTVAPGRSLYIFVHNVDETYETCLSNGVEIQTELALREYGMRDFDILDPDGYQISFGLGVQA